MEEMKWSSAVVSWCIVAANILGFGLVPAEICQTAFWSATVPKGHGMSKISHAWLKSAKLPFGQQQCQEDMACPKSAIQSLDNMVTSLIGPIWRK
jgi:hypothetical protein